MGETVHTQTASARIRRKARPPPGQALQPHYSAEGVDMVVPGPRELYKTCRILKWSRIKTLVLSFVSTAQLQLDTYALALSYKSSNFYSRLLLFRLAVRQNQV